MSKKEFDKWTGKPLDTIPHKPKPVPDHLDEVEKPGNVKVKFNIKDYIRIIFMYLLSEAEKKLNPAEYVVADKFWTCFIVAGSLFTLVILLKYLL